MDAAGNLYGTTVEGGSSNAGTIFEIFPSGSEAVLHNFARGSTDGAEPAAGLTMDAAGNLDGTTQAGGPSDAGTVFTTYTGLIKLVNQFTTKVTVASDLDGILNGSLEALRNGNKKSANNQLDAFINAVSAQSGKAIPNKAHAAILIKDAQGLMT